MQLMPHIKSLLDDLISMTKKITVKQSDLAIANAGNSEDEDMWYRYLEAKNGDSTYLTYPASTIPYEVLASLLYWRESNNIDDYGITLANSVDGYVTIDMGSFKIICSAKDPERYGLTRVGDLYFQYKNPKLYKLYKETTTIHDLNTKLYKYNDDGTKEEIVSFSEVEEDEDGNITFNTLKTYVQDNSISEDTARNKIEIKYKIQSEYIPKGKEIDDFENCILIGDGTQPIFRYRFSDEAKITTDSVDNVDIPIFGILTSKGLEFSSSDMVYIYDVDDNGGCIDYIYDPKLEDYRILTSDMVETGNYDNEDIFIKRYYLEFYRSDDMDTEGYAYFKRSETVDSSRYVECSNKIQSINEYGELEYDDDDNPIMVDEVFYHESYIDDDTYVSRYLNQFSCDYDKIERDDINIPVAYAKYIDKKYGLIDFNEPLIDQSTGKPMTDAEGNVLLRYEDELFYAYGENTNYKRADISLEVASNDSTVYSFYIKDNNGDYIDNDYGYYKYIGSFETDKQRYSQISYSNPIFTVINENGSYSISDTYVNPCYTFYDPDMITYISDNLFTDSEIRSIINGTRVVSDTYKDVVKNAMDEYIMNKYAPYEGDNRWLVTRYDGELNEYYRELNGLPEYDSVSEPKIDKSTFTSSYTDSDRYSYLYDLSDDEVEIIENNGMLKEFQVKYPDKLYLRHLGRNRIDTIFAREAAPYDILMIGSYENIESYNVFKDAYKLSRNYILHRHYQPEMFDTNPYYGVYIGFLILTHALDVCMAQSGEILTQNKYNDYDTVQLKLKSFGFEHTFDSIPLIYRKEIAKKLELLIRNKGIDDIYDIIYNIFGIYDVEVYKYYFRKLTNGNTKDLSIAQVPISSKNPVRDIINPDNRLSYDDITGADRYWGVYVDPDSIKKELLDDPFNYINSKYITLNNKFNLSQLNFNSSYILNYIAETIGPHRFMIPIDGLDNSQSLKNLVVMLFAIQAKRYNYSGNISQDEVATAPILKFNVLDSVINNGETSTILNIISDHYDKMSGNKKYKPDNTVVNSGKYNAKVLQDIIIKSGAIIKPDWSTTQINNNILDAIADAYLENLTKDSALTVINENSFYNEVIKLRSNATNIHDYNCYNDLFKCIAMTETLKDAYKLTGEPKYELIGSCETKDDNKNFTWYYNKYDNYWELITDIDEVLKSKNKPTEDNTAISGKFPTDFSKDYFINTSELESRDGITDFDSLITNDKVRVYKKVSIDADNATEISTFCSKPITKTKTNESGTYYIEKIYNEKEDYNTINIYYCTDTALTFEMYLKHEGSELYNYLQKRNNEELSSYKDRLNEMFSIIIASIENSISNESIRRQLNLSYNDFSNISRYIKIVIEVFKSFTVDLASMDAIYEINDTDFNRVKFIDQTSINEMSTMNCNINIHSDVSFDESMVTSSIIQIRDEIIIEEFAKDDNGNYTIPVKSEFNY